MTPNRFTRRLNNDDEYRRAELIKRIEHAVEGLSLAELEALSYDLITKGYLREGN